MDNISTMTTIRDNNNANECKSSRSLNIIPSCFRRLTSYKTHGQGVHPRRPVTQSNKIINISQRFTRSNVINSIASLCINTVFLDRSPDLDTNISVGENTTESEWHDKTKDYMTLTAASNKMSLKSIVIVIAFASVVQLTDSIDYVLFNGRRPGRFGILLEITNANTASIVCDGDLLYFDNFNNYACSKLGHGRTFVSLIVL